MNGIEKITGQIGADAQREIDALLAEAAAQAQRVSAQAAERAEAEAEELLRRGREEAERREDQAGRVHALEERKLLLGAKGEMVAQAFDRALDALVALDDAAYITLLAGLAVNASRTGAEQVLFSQRDRNRVGKAVVTRANEILGTKGALTLAEGTRAIRGGLILVDGNVETNCSLETLVRARREDLEAQVAKVLFD